MVTKGGHLRSGRLYRTNRTIKQGVAESYKSLVYRNVEI